MAWLTQGLRSLESALERVDQQAASTLTPLKPGASSQSSEIAEQPPAEPPQRAAAQPTSSLSPVKSAPHSAKKEYNDDELFDYLNDSKPNNSTESVSSIRSASYAAPLFAKPTATLPRPPSTKPTAKAFGSSLHSSAGDFTSPSSTSDSSTSAFLSRLAPSSLSASAHSEPRAPSTPSPQRTRAESKDLADGDSLSSSSPISLLDTPAPAPASAAIHYVPAPSTQLSTSSATESMATLRNQRDEAEMANRLLKTQMKELNGEIQDLTERAKASHAAAEKATEQVRELQQRLQERERAFVVLKRSEEALRAKVTEAEGLAAKNAALQGELKGRDAIIADLQTKLEKSKSETREISGKGEEEAQALLEQERAHFAESRKGFLEREAQLLSAAEASAQEMMSLQRKLQEKTDALNAANAHAKEHTTEVRNVRQELSEYKSRATKVLQQREKTIEELTEKLSQGTSAAASASLTQLVQLQQERDLGKTELADANATIEQLKQHLSEIQAQAESEVESFRVRLPSLEEKLDKERKRVQLLQVELLARGSDVTALKEAAETEKREKERVFAEMEKELVNLRKIAALQRNGNGASQDQKDLESRMRTMTEHIINNQSVIDRLSSEKHSLQVQLETMQKHQAIAQATVPQREEDIEARAEQTVRLRPIASLAPSLALREGFVSRRVFKAANALDGLSSAFGALLRSSPTARLSFLAYLAVLHLWLVYVMFTLTPEIHRPEDLEKHKEM